MKQSEYGFVYLMQVMDFIKIGYTTDVQRRFKIFDLMFPPIGLELLDYIESGRARSIEKELHIAFDDKRAKGEWFELSSEDIGYIKEHYRFIETEVIRNVYESYIVEVKAMGTGYEQQILRLIAAGYTHRDVAERLNIPEQMVEGRALEIYDRLVIDEEFKQVVLPGNEREKVPSLYPVISNAYQG